MKFITKIFFILFLTITNNAWSQIIQDSEGNKFLTLGSTQDEVIEVLGTPSKISYNDWYYGFAYLTFYGDKISQYSNAEKLKIKLVPKSKNNESNTNSLSKYQTTSSTNKATSASSLKTSTSSNSSVADGYGEISKLTGRPKTVHVSGYTKKDGTYAKPYYRSSPKRK